MCYAMRECVLGGCEDLQKEEEEEEEGGSVSK